MRLGDEDPSGNFIDRTGSSGGGFGFGGGGGGNMLGCLLPLVASRFGIVGIAILLLGYCALTQLGGGGGSLIPTGGGPTTTSAPSGQSTLDPALRDVMTRVLGSTERRWTEIFQRNGMTYQPTTMVAYSNTDQSGCGVAQAAMGPFYCPTDKRIYVDPTFFNELSQRFGAPGDFAIAYVRSDTMCRTCSERSTRRRARRPGRGGSKATGSRWGSSSRPIAWPESGRRTTRI